MALSGFLGKMPKVKLSEGIKQEGGINVKYLDFNWSLNGK